jgi:hypothetical protein
MKLGYMSHLARRICVKNYIAYYILKKTKQSKPACPQPDIRNSKHKDTKKGFQKYIHVFRLFKVSL